VLKNDDIDGSQLSAQEASSLTGFIGVADLIGNYVHGLGSGLAIFNSGTSLDATVQGNYVTGLVSYGDPATTGNHSDAFTVRDFTDASDPSRQLLIEGNRFDCDSASATGALFVQSYSGPIDNVTITGNLLEGGGYQLGLNDLNYPYANLTATNNRFTGTGWGPAYVQGGAGWTSWSSNYLNDPSVTDNEGQAVAQPLG